MWDKIYKCTISLGSAVNFDEFTHIFRGGTLHGCRIWLRCGHVVQLGLSLVLDFPPFHLHQRLRTRIFINRWIWKMVKIKSIWILYWSKPRPSYNTLCKYHHLDLRGFCIKILLSWSSKLPEFTAKYLIVSSSEYTVRLLNTQTSQSRK